ncbi:Autophagy protein 5 [Forsythia ovata]
MSQSDQADLWHSVLNGNMEAYLRVSSKLKLGTIGDDYSLKLNSTSKSRQRTSDTDATAPIRTGRIPVRLYIRSINEDIDDLEDAPIVDSWDKISYINRPVEIWGEGKCFTLYNAVKALLPELFADKHLLTDNVSKAEMEDGQQSEEISSLRSPEEGGETSTEHAGSPLDTAEIKFLRIQGIEPKMEIPFGWVVNNLMNPEHYLHICVYIKVVEPITI